MQLVLTDCHQAGWTSYSVQTITTSIKEEDEAYFCFRGYADSPIIVRAYYSPTAERKDKEKECREK